MQQLKEHNSKGMRLQEILRYMKRDLSHYSWCLITLRILTGKKHRQIKFQHLRKV